jgi:CheY-like chemotaxis protein
MDIKMPKMNGIEATKEIKKLRPDLRIIALTAFAMESEKRYVLKEGCDDYISKPVSPEYLQKIIKQNIRSDK